MRVSAAIVPPREVVEELERLVASVHGEHEPETPRWRSLLKRRADPQSASGVALAPRRERQLETVPASGMHLPLTGFGNVVAGDVKRLVEVVGAQAAAWQAPTVRFSGGTALEFPGDNSVWAMLTGDLDALRVIGAGVPSAVRPLGFVVDRRQFRTWMPVGTITDHTTAPFLEAVVNRLDEHRSMPWTIDHISVVRRSLEDGNPELQELERLPVGRAGR